MKLFTSISRAAIRAQALLGVAVVLAAVAVPAISMAATATTGTVGSDRPTKAYVEGMQGFDHVQFNSFTGVPGIGDERNFLTADLDGETGGTYDPMTDVRTGDTIVMRVYIHNNADSSLNANGTGIAQNTKVRVALPTSLSANQTASAFISADNAQPKVIEDTLTMKSASPVALQYVPGSALIETKSGAFKAALGDDIVKDGVTIGSEALDGNYKGCFEYESSVLLKVKVTSPAYTLTKSVRLNGSTTFTKSVTAKPGDKVDFSLGFHNTGTTALNNVAIGDRLPVGLTYVPGSTTWDSGFTNNQWTKVTNDNWMSGGLNVGNYAPGATAFIRFTAQVDDASKLQCGLNRITNFAFTKPEGQGTIQDSAEVDVTKTCVTPTPTPTPTPATPVATPPTTLVNTGAGNIFAIFGAVTVLGAAAHYLFQNRRFANR